MLRRLPIAVQVMALVALATLLASAAMVAIAFGGPPPRERPYSPDELADALKGDAPLPSGLSLTFAEPKPQVPSGMRPCDDVARLLMKEFGATPVDIVVFCEPGHQPPHGQISGAFLVAYNGPLGWSVLESGPDRAKRRWLALTSVTIGGVLLTILLLAWWLSRQIAAPIRALGETAQQARGGAEWQVDVPDGPPEVRETALSLQNLHRRTLEETEQRMTILAAIAHDIGTPLARIAFRAEALPDAQRDAAQGDIATVRRLLTDSLTLARGGMAGDEEVELALLCREIVELEQEHGRAVTHGELEPCIVRGSALGLQRMVQNLIDNAVRYGASAFVTLRAQGRESVLTVADEGPGFPDMAQDQLLRPYVRGEASRNIDSGGSGLGLAIVAQVLELHGGSIVLGAGGHGGALVTVRLPPA
jgi:signal transduction histidine kinase